MRRTAISLLLSVALAASIHSVELSAPYPPNWSMTPQEIVETYGPPDVAFGSFMSYIAVYADLDTDVTCWVTGGTLDRVSLSFDVGNGEVSSLRNAFTRVAKRLRLTYGVPDLITRSRFDYETHIWYLPGGELRHRVIYTPGRTEHSLESIRSRNP